MHVFMQIRLYKNAAYFATSPAYFGYVHIAFFFSLAAFFQGDCIDVALIIKMLIVLQGHSKVQCFVNTKY